MPSTDALRKREYRAAKQSGLILETHCNCGAKLTRASSHAPLCKRCWRKTDEGREYMTAKKVESRKQKPKAKAIRDAIALFRKSLIKEKNDGN